MAQLVDARLSEGRALRAWEFDSPLGHWILQARQMPNWLSYGRCARFDTGACNLRVGQCSAGPHKPGQPGATPGPATTGYANWHSGEVESLVPVGSSPTSVTDKERDPVVQRQRRLGDNQESAGSIPAGITDAQQ